MNGIQVTNEELSQTVEAGRRRMATEFRAGSVRYDPARDAIELTMVDGWSLVFLRSAMAELAEIPSQDMGKLEISPVGTHAGLPWLLFLRRTLVTKIHFWPFDGWAVPLGRSVVAEVYPNGNTTFPKGTAIPTSMTPIASPPG
ncbi:hypothetical protein [Magnetospirillum sp. SS-4]|jgi:hypothetical protein|uniref:hypothetical protein n=1 Tax=Magnetospirillum sp. SS-4 TaxID=2681465 RepID=UPI00137F3382|nr:hypothetical protein [Magnetospirillum sp. SS-4]CAA7624209.1 hypothetical protein MTBSS4_440026 [Magnetospirillum sp. SS-4]